MDNVCHEKDESDLFQMRQPRRQPIERGRGARMTSTTVQIRWIGMKVSLRSFPKEVIYEKEYINKGVIQKN
jgi:hypothetical protein